MADLNNTLQAIEHCANGGYCIRCKLRDDRRCDAITSCKTLLTDALELLKEQQPKKPVYDCPLIRCPRCKNSINVIQKYCDECGQAIDWSKDGEQE